MKKRFAPSIVVVVLAMTVHAQEADLMPPTVEKKVKELTIHGDTRQDEYYWLRERENPAVTSYLSAENDYWKAKLASTNELQEKLAAETKARIKQTDESVPYPDNGYSYYRRTEDGLQYPIYCRRKLDKSGAAEEVMVDVNKVAEGHEFCSVRGVRVSPDTKLMAYAVDTVGRRKYTLKVRDLATGQELNDEIADVTGNHVWANDNQTIFYVRQDPQTLRWFQVFRHKLGTSPEEDILVYQEDDEEFSCYVGKSRSRDYVFIYCEQTLSTETRYIDANTPAATPVVFQPREADHEYSVEHLGRTFLRAH